MRFLVFLLATAAAPAMAGETRIDINLHFDPAAVAALQQMGEMVTIGASFYGEPSATNTLPVDEVGWITLGNENVTVWPVDQVVHIGGNLGAAPMSSVLAPQVNVNVYSARFVSEDNVLDCSIVEGATDDLSKNAQDITCKLIGG
jgi:hypothetical protein